MLSKKYSGCVKVTVADSYGTQSASKYLATVTVSDPKWIVLQYPVGMNVWVSSRHELPDYTSSVWGDWVSSGHILLCTGLFQQSMLP